MGDRMEQTTGVLKCCSEYRSYFHISITLSDSLMHVNIPQLSVGDGGCHVQDLQRKEQPLIVFFLFFFTFNYV